MPCIWIINGTKPITHSNTGSGSRVNVRDEQLEVQVRAEKFRRAAHLNDDRSTAESPGRMPKQET